MRGSGSFFRGRSKYHYKRDIIGLPAKRQMACRCWPNIECWIVSFMVLQGIRTNIAKKPYIFVIFQRGGGSGPPVPPLDPRMPFPFMYLANIPKVLSGPQECKSRTVRIRVVHRREMYKIRNLCNFAQVSLFVHTPHVFENRKEISPLHQSVSVPIPDYTSLTTVCFYYRNIHLSC